jgi:hypothetical protein
MKGRWILVLALALCTSLVARADLHQHSILDSSSIHLELWGNTNAANDPPEAGEWGLIGSGDINMVGGMNVVYDTEPTPYDSVTVPSIMATNSESWGTWFMAPLNAPPINYVYAWLEFQPGQIKAITTSVPTGTVQPDGSFSIPGHQMYYEMTSFDYSIWWADTGTLPPTDQPPDNSVLATYSGPPTFPPPEDRTGYLYPYMMAQTDYIDLLWFAPTDPTGDYIFGTEGPINTDDLPASFTGQYTDLGGGEMQTEVSHGEVRYEDYVVIDSGSGLGVWMSIRITGDYIGMTPEPSSMLLLVGGLGTLVAIRRKRS